MAQFPRVNGDAGGVAHYDVAQYENGSAVGTGVTINPHGPKFDYIAVDFGASLTNAAFQTGGPIEAVISTIQQLATVATYEIAADQTVATVRCSKFALYPVGGTSAAALQTAIRALGTVDGYDLSGATVVATTFGA
jgi:hypothetical protein